MTQLFQASTLYQVASLAAMIDAGAVPEDDDRVLCIVDTTRQPELVPGITGATGFEELSSRFDRVINLGEFIRPLRPHQFAPRDFETPMWRKLLCKYFDLPLTEPGHASEISLWLESLQVNPGRALANIFYDAPITVHADGLMAYGPLRDPLPMSIGSRLDRVVHLDIVPGLKPLYGREWDAATDAVALEHFTHVIDEWANKVEPSEACANIMRSGKPVGFILGQYLNELKLITDEEEHELTTNMAQAAIDAGAEIIAFKPHPSASYASRTVVREIIESAGLEYVDITDTVPAEIVATWIKPVVAVSIFSTALATLHYGYDIPAVSIGADQVVHNLNPYPNSNRVPVMLADALFHRNIPVPDEEKHSGASHDQELGSHYEGRLQALLNTVGYTMQPDRMKDLYPSAYEFCSADPALRKLYIRKGRLYRLGLMKTTPDNFYEHFVGHLDDMMGTNNLNALKKKLQTSKVLKHPTNAAVKILSSFGQRKSR
ncbi:polysialyltransferase family glycosyltransferase [Pseudoglutamicibacter cumminsii]|uniref:polysialyltransferase family glycosyltransferase n=1 Tax=Pseudoglutamicibacter cumminsii TaxID=156979 RepID=UPI002554D56B|nr:polysialyltransferase family glycosyltransferase [Pseudoglutamicibacter cumminsii]MDK7083223.1 polysialyltransferase family glycosyltransferase [Pseudoglutamicibacter cumminsii]